MNEESLEAPADAAAPDMFQRRGSVVEEGARGSTTTIIM